MNQFKKALFTLILSGVSINATTLLAQTTPGSALNSDAQSLPSGASALFCIEKAGRFLEKDSHWGSADRKEGLFALELVSNSEGSYYDFKKNASSTIYAARLSQELQNDFNLKLLEPALKIGAGKDRYIIFYSGKYSLSAPSLAVAQDTQGLVIATLCVTVTQK